MSTSLLKARVVQAFGGACQRCGYNRCLRALHLHHLDPTTKSPRNWSGTILRDAERYPERFILLCANCHIEEHEAQDRARMPTLTCAHCGQPYKVGSYVARAGRSRYCSRRCFSDSLIGQPSRKPPAKIVTLTCRRCGRDYPKHEYIAKTGRSHYCSRDCQYRDRVNARYRKTDARP